VVFSDSQGSHSTSFLSGDHCVERPELIGSVAMGLVCTDGIVLGVERLLHSKLLVKGSNRRIQSADEHIGLATAGLLADGKHMGSRAREECANFRDTYNSPVTVGVRQCLLRTLIRTVADE